MKVFSGIHKESWARLGLVLMMLGCWGCTKQPTQEVQELRTRLDQLERELAETRALLAQLQATKPSDAANQSSVRSTKPTDEKGFPSFLETIRRQAPPSKISDQPSLPWTHSTKNKAPLGEDHARQEPQALAVVQLYNEARNLAQKGANASATAYFETVLKTAPNHRLAPNALFWLGRLYLEQGQHQAAGTSFEKLLAQYPDESKAPEALFELAILRHHQGEQAEARGLLERLISVYPQSPASARAKSLLTADQIP